MLSPWFRASVVALAVLAASALPTQVRAQSESASCARAPIQFQDACQKTTDVFDYLAPQLGTAMAGGNATPGQVGTVGGLGHFWLGLRGSAVNGTVPQFNDIAVSPLGARSDSIPTKSFPVPMADLEAAVGLFRGVPLGVTHVGSVDLLLNAFYVPSFSSSDVQVKPNNPIKLGFGGRIGLLQERGLIPGAAVSYVRRDLPTTSVYTTDANGDSLQVQDLSVRASSWRFTVGKTFAVLGLVAGIGQDSYDATTAIGATVDGTSSGTTPLATPHETDTRTNYFFDASLNLSIVRIVGEVGQVAGGDIATYNTFVGTAPNATRTYGSLGLGIKI